MTSEVDRPPALVRSAFRLYVGAVAVSAANAVLQVVFDVSPFVVLLNPILEATLFLGIGARMRGGSRLARTVLLGVAGLFIAVNLAFAAGLTSAFHRHSTALTALLLILVTAKVALIAAATWMMYRPPNHSYFQ